jgi:hypothetical protein
MAVPTLEVDRTNIDTVSKITFANSHSFRVQNIAKTNTIQSLKAYLWIWNGAQNKALQRLTQPMLNVR